MFDEQIIKSVSKPTLGWTPSSTLINIVEADIRNMKHVSREDAIASLLVKVKDDICNTKTAMNVNMVNGRKFDLVGGVTEEEQKKYDDEMAVLYKQLESLKERLWFLNILK